MINNNNNSKNLDSPTYYLMIDTILDAVMNFPVVQI